MFLTGSFVIFSTRDTPRRQKDFLLGQPVV
jgi:hypothetical protein